MIPTERSEGVQCAFWRCDDENRRVKPSFRSQLLRRLGDAFSGSSVGVGVLDFEWRPSAVGALDEKIAGFVESEDSVSCFEELGDDLGFIRVSLCPVSHLSSARHRKKVSAPWLTLLGLPWGFLV